MKLSKLLKNSLSEGMATGPGDIEIKPLEQPDATSTKPEKGKTVKDVKSAAEVTDISKKEEKKEKEKAKKTKFADLTKLNQGLEAIAKGEIDTDVDFKKEVKKVEDFYKSKKELTDEDKKTLDTLDKIKDENINVLTKIKNEFKKSKNLLDAILKGTGNE